MSAIDFPDISISRLQPRIFDPRSAVVDYYARSAHSYRQFRYDSREYLPIARGQVIDIIGCLQTNSFAPPWTTIAKVDLTTKFDSSIRQHLPLFDQLPLAKKLDLISALQKIEGEITEIEYSEDGEIIIETRENDQECFYAVSTLEGDFKGTWLSNGTLLRQPWPADPRSGSRLQSLI